MEVPLKAGGIHIANIKVVHAKIHRVAAASVRVGPEPRSDRSQLFDLASQRFEVPETHGSGRGQLAAAGRLGRGPAGRDAVRTSPASLRNPSAHSGLCAPSSGAAIQPSPDAATPVGGIPPEPSRGLRLQPLLRTLPWLAPSSGRGAPPRAQGRRKALRGLRRGYGPHP